MAAMSRVSQREARRLRKRVAELEQEESRRRRAWASDYPGGVQITSTKWESAGSTVPTAISTARKLGHAVVAITESDGLVRFLALPLGGK